MNWSKEPSAATDRSKNTNIRMIQPSVEVLRDQFEQRWRTFFSDNYDRHDPLQAVLHYVSEGKGKRVRAVLSLLCAESCGVPALQALPAAIAVEMIHSYSLVHDDLPCMDDDDIRRGRPTAHIKFSVPLALLAGDALLTDAFQVLTDAKLLEKQNYDSALSDRQRVALVRELALASGGAGMAQGQCLDVLHTGDPLLDVDMVTRIHTQKTGMLLGAACAMGAICGGANEATTESFRNFGILIGLAFQVKDDLLDKSLESGKTPGKDQKAGKITFSTLMSESEALAFGVKCTKNAKSMLESNGNLYQERLMRFVDQLLDRTK